MAHFLSELRLASAEQRTQRLLIDCSHIDFSRQPTGIPRVVLKYIEVGYDWGRRTGVKVIPVVPTHSGVFICRPVPGRSSPQDLLFAAKDKGEAGKSLGAELAASSLNYIADVAHHLLYLGAALAPFIAITVFSRSADSRLVKRVKDAAERMARSANQPLRIDLRPGDVVFTPAYWHDVDPEIYRNIRSAGARMSCACA